MKIKFSRHAKRRAKLYKIPESTISEVLATMELTQGEHEIIKDLPGFKFPIKIFIVVEKKVITVITSYPLKEGRKK